MIHLTIILQNLSRNAHSQVVVGVVTTIVRELLTSTRNAPLLPRQAMVDVVKAYARQDMLIAVANPTPALPPPPSCAGAVIVKVVLVGTVII